MMSTDYRLQLLFLHLLREVDRKLDLVLQGNSKLEKIGAKIMSTGVTAAQALSDLQAQVAAEQTVEQSAVTLITNLIQQVQQANGVSPAAVEAVIAQLQANIQPLATAVSQNTIASTQPSQVGVTVPAGQTDNPANPGTPVNPDPAVVAEQMNAQSKIKKDLGQS